MPGLFCDSWEVAPEGLWTDGLDKTFKEHSAMPLAHSSALDAHPDVRYDYRKLLSATALG